MLETERKAFDSIAIVTHGTVLALFLAQYANRPAFELWREFGLPSFAVLELPGYRVVEIVPQIDLTVGLNRQALKRDPSHGALRGISHHHAGIELSATKMEAFPSI
jgi:broad specificity phosphatase PhoE